MGKGGGQDWNCGVCTFINESTAVRCEMCMTPSPTTGDDAGRDAVGGQQQQDLTYLRPVANDDEDDHHDRPNTSHEASSDDSSHQTHHEGQRHQADGADGDQTTTRRSSAVAVAARLPQLDLDFFVGLPSELNAGIFGLLDPKDIVNLSLVCRWLCDEIARNDYVWRQMFLKTYQREERFVLMEGLDNGMARTGWRRAFKLQFYLQVMADLCDLVSESKFYLLHTSLTQDAHDDRLITYDRSVGVEEGGQFSMLYRWRGDQLRLSLSDPPAASTEQADRPSRPGDWIEDVGTTAEWDEEFQSNLQARIKKCASDAERDEVLELGTTWIGKGEIVRAYCGQFTRCIVRRDHEEEAALRRNQRRLAVEAQGEAKDENEGDHGDDVWHDTLQTILNDQSNWKERDSGCARRLMIKMLAKSPPINPPYVTLPFDSWTVAKEYVDSLLDLFGVGERGCARYFCLAQEFETGAADRFLVLGLMAVSPHRTLFFASVYGLTLAQLDAVRMAKYMAEVDTEGYNYEDEVQETTLSDGPWACPFCTFVNYDSKYKCYVCDNYRSASKRTDIA